MKFLKKNIHNKPSLNTLFEKKINFTIEEHHF